MLCVQQANKLQDLLFILTLEWFIITAFKSREENNADAVKINQSRSIFFIENNNKIKSIIQLTSRK